MFGILKWGMPFNPNYKTTPTQVGGYTCLTYKRYLSTALFKPIGVDATHIVVIQMPHGDGIA